MLLTAALSLAFFLSGAAGLVFEIVWFHRAGLVFGNSVVAAAIVLSSFMGGLAIGNAAAGWMAARARRLLAVYAALEVAVAVSGLALTFVLPRLSHVDAPIGLAFVLLLVPSSAMGATLPVLVAAWRSRTGQSDSFGWVLGTLYAWNTLGAVAGALGAELVLVDSLGIAGSAWVAAGLNVTAAAIAIGQRRLRGEARARHVPGTRTSEGHSLRTVLLLLCAFLAGFAMLALEVIWFRFLSMFVLTTSQAMSVMLAVVLAGIAIGGLASAVGSKRAVPAPIWIPVAALTAAVAVTTSYTLLGRLTSGTQLGAWPAIVWIATVLTLPTAIASGALFTLIGAAIRQHASNDAGAAASLTLANTIGAAVGPVVAAFLLLPAVGTERSLFALTLVYAVIALLTAWRDGRRRAALVVIASVVVAVAFPFGAMAGYLTRITAPYADDGSRIVATREGSTESIALMQQQWMGKPVYDRLVTNGFSMSGTSLAGQRYMRYFVYWPMLVHRMPLSRILVICYGAGVTAGAATDVPTATSIDVVELSRDIVSMSGIIYAGGRDPLSDPRVRLHIDDGRHFLRQTGERFDLITGEPPPPRTPGTENIYTREYFGLMRDRLADEGIATYWVPVARPHPGTDVNTIIRAFCDVFDDCSLWNATPFDLMLVGSRGGPSASSEPRFDPSRFDALRDRLAEVGFEMPEQIGATFLGDAAFLRELTAATPPLTDDFPQRLRPVAARPSLSDPRYPDDSAVVEQYRRVLDPARAREAFAHSSQIAARWPAAMRDATLPWFDTQAIVNRVFWEGGKPVRLIADLDATLTRTPLKALPLWILDGDAVKQRIAASGNDGTGAVEYMRGAELLVNRDYESAASYFALAERRGLKSPNLRPLIAYALCKAGRTEMSKAIVDRLAPRDDDERRFVGWMREKCESGESGGPGRAGR